MEAADWDGLRHGSTWRVAFPGDCVCGCVFLCTFRVFRFRRGTSSGALAATAFRKMPSGMGKAKQADVQFIVPVDEVAPVYDTYTSILMSTASGDGYVAAPPKPIRASRQPALTV